MASSRQGPSAKAAAANFVPVHEWHDGDGSYLLRLNLPGFKEDDFRVHVDPAGRLTILGQRPADGGAGDVRLVFQLPSTSNLYGITGRYDGSVLSLTVPKLPAGAATPPPQAKEEADEEDTTDKPTDQKSKVGREAERSIEAAKARLPGRQRDQEKDEQTGRSKKPPPATKADERKEEPKVEATAKPTEKAAKRGDGQDDRAKAEYKAKVEREAERRIDAARARLGAEREKGCWKERAADEGFKWAEAVVKNKEVIAATAVAAFTLGVFVSHRLFYRN